MNTIQLSLFESCAESAKSELISGLQYLKNFISPEHESRLLTIIDSETWLLDLKRRVQHYGYRYNYKSRSIDTSLYLGELPNWAIDLAEKFKKQNLIDILPDQVIVNEYCPGQGITHHVDCETCFSDTIISLSLGSSCVMDFIDRFSKEKKSVLLQPRSLVVLKEDARYRWTHGIAPRKTDLWQGVKIARQRRVSLTFRKMRFQ